MKLWILKPKDTSENWKPWYDKAFGFVVRAETEEIARGIAAENCGDEEETSWLLEIHSTCEELTVEGSSELLLRDFAAA